MIYGLLAAHPVSSGHPIGCHCQNHRKHSRKIMMGKVRTKSGWLGDEVGTWVSYDDYKKLEKDVRQLESDNLCHDYIVLKKQTECGA